MNYALFVGTGSSLGVPVIGCKCNVCLSSEQKNKRWRSSVYVSIGNRNLLIDAGPDFRSQALKYSIDKLDGVIFTHAHQDHSAGIDDLRPFYFLNKKSLPCLVLPDTAQELINRFGFMFMAHPHEHKNVQRLELIVTPSQKGEVNFLEIPIKYFNYRQLGMDVMGIRIGTFAYLTDLKEYSVEILDQLRGIDTLIVSALRFTPSHMHLTVDEAIDFIHKIQPKKAYLTHISHELDHEKTNAYLPPNIQLAYDGLKITI